MQYICAVVWWRDVREGCEGHFRKEGKHGQQVQAWHLASKWKQTYRQTQLHELSSSRRDRGGVITGRERTKALPMLADLIKLNVNLIQLGFWRIVGFLCFWGGLFVCLFVFWLLRLAFQSLKHWESHTASPATFSSINMILSSDIGFSTCAPFLPCVLRVEPRTLSIHITELHPSKHNNFWAMTLGFLAVTWHFLHV